MSLRRTWFAKFMTNYKQNGNICKDLHDYCLYSAKELLKMVTLRHENSQFSTCLILQKTPVASNLAENYHTFAKRVNSLDGMMGELTDNSFHRVVDQGVIIQLKSAHISPHTKLSKSLTNELATMTDACKFVFLLLVPLACGGKLAD